MNNLKPHLKFLRCRDIKARVYLRLINTWGAFAYLFFVVFIWGAVAEAATFYKYMDEKGTLVLTDRLEEVPSAFRKKIEKIELPDGVTQEMKDPLPLEEIEEKIKDVPLIAEEKIRVARTGLSSFLEDRKRMLMAYGLVAIVSWMVLFFLLKRIVGGLAAKIVLNLAVMAILFSGAYLIYLSWLNKTILNFNPVGTEDKSIMEQLTAPQDLIDQTQTVVDQLNTKTDMHQGRLREIEGP